MRVHECACLYVCSPCTYAVRYISCMVCFPYKMLLNDEEIKAKTALWMTENGEYLKEMEGTYMDGCICIYICTSMDG